MRPDPNGPPRRSLLRVSRRGEIGRVVMRAFVLLAATAASLVIVAVASATVVLTIVFSERKRQRGPLPPPEDVIASAGAVINALFGRPKVGCHGCAQCGAPIEPPSRAEFCSPVCRRYARLRKLAA